MSYECNHKHRLRSTAKQPKKNISYARRNKVWQNLQNVIDTIKTGGQPYSGINLIQGSTAPLNAAGLLAPYMTNMMLLFCLSFVDSYGV